jgi:hypothetical protein
MAVIGDRVAELQKLGSRTFRSEKIILGLDIRDIV